MGLPWQHFEGATLKAGIAERRNHGKYPQILKHGITENDPNPKTRNRCCEFIVFHIIFFQLFSFFFVHPPSHLGQQCICNNYNKKVVFFAFYLKFLRFPVLCSPPFRICDDIPAFRRLRFGVYHLHIASWCVVVTEANNSVA